MAQVYPAEGTDPTDTTIGGVVVKFPSGRMRSMAWRQNAPIDPVLDGAKAAVTKLVDALLKGDSTDREDLERTNVTSLVAAVQKLMMDWNEKRRAALYAERPSTDVPSLH